MIFVFQYKAANMRAWQSIGHVHYRPKLKAAPGFSNVDRDYKQDIYISIINCCYCMHIYTGEEDLELIWQLISH